MDGSAFTNPMSSNVMHPTRARKVPQWTWKENMLFVQVGQLVPPVSWDTPCFIQNNKEHRVDVNKNSGDHWRDPGTRDRDVWAAVDRAGGSFCQLSSSTGVSERGLFLCMKSQS